jgi:hypothetical protein
VLTEPVGPYLVERRSVTLQVPHHDADSDDIRQRRVGGREDRDQVVEDLLGLRGDVLRYRVIFRVGPEQRGNMDPVAGLDRLRDPDRCAMAPDRCE